MDLNAQLSPHFKAKEFACHCGGHFPGCHILVVNAKLISALEVLRSRYYPTGLSIVDAYRCPMENARAEKASGQVVLPNSEHVKGTAADIPGKATLEQVKSLGLFTGIGYQKANGLVTHVDVRVPPRGYGVNRPVTWSYPLG